MKPLWIFKNVMQVIVHCRILRQLPANLGTTLDALNYAVYLKPHYLLAEEILRKYFMDDIEIDEVQSKIMKEWGIEDESYFWSLGIFAVLGILMLFLVFIYLSLRLYHYLSKTSKFGKEIMQYLDKKLFFGAICRYMIEAYLKISHNTLLFLAL